MSSKEELAFNAAINSIEEKQKTATVLEVPTLFAQKQNSEKN